METLLQPVVTDQALTHTSDYLNYKKQEIHQGKDAALLSAMATGTT